MKMIQVSKGRFQAMVDDEDYDLLINHTWSAEISRYKNGKIRTVYAKTTQEFGEKRQTIKMHRMILGLKYGDGIMVDHKDRNGLNNQKTNIRICEHYQNMTNRVKHRGTSKYMGVSWHKVTRKYFRKKTNDYANSDTGSWWAKIVVNGTQLSLGHFKNEEDAARCYNKFAKAIHGEFANLNEIND